MGVARSIAGVQPFAELFQGATTTVYKGYEPSLNRFVLLKVLRPEFSADEVLARRFEEEAQMAARIQHANVVTVYSFGCDEDGTYIIAEFIEGMNLRVLIERGKLPPELAAYVLLQVACGLQAAHQEGILHRDIKPENILISHEGQVKLADFGMASLAESMEDAAEIRGTLGYLSPEQVLGDSLGAPSDLFSLGATFYEMLTGRAAFVGDQLAQIFDSVVHHDPMPYLDAGRTVPRALVQICCKLLVKNPQARYPDTAALIGDLEAWLESVQVPANSETLQLYLQDPDAFVPLPVELFEPVPAISGDGHASELEEPVVQLPAIPQPGDSDEQRARNRRRIVIGGAAATLLLLALIVLVSVSGSWLWGGSSKQDGLASGDSAAIGADSLLAGSMRPEEQVLIDSVLQAVLREGGRNRKGGKGRNGSDRMVGVSGDMSNPGKLAVNCNPFCQVYVDGVHVGMSPITRPVEIQPGVRQITLRNDNYPDVVMEADVDPGETEELRVILNEHVGQIEEIRVHPYADVFVDGTHRGLTPLDGPLYLLPGTHTLVLRHKTLGTYETEVSVEAGEKKQLEFNLEELLKK